MGIEGERWSRHCVTALKNARLTTGESAADILRVQLHELGYFICTAGNRSPLFAKAIGFNETPHPSLVIPLSNPYEPSWIHTINIFDALGIDIPDNAEALGTMYKRELPFFYGSCKFSNNW